MASKPKVMAPANDVRDHAPQAEDTVGKDRAQERENTGTALDRTQGTVNMSATAVRGRGGQRNVVLQSVRGTMRGRTAEKGNMTGPVNVTERGTGIVKDIMMSVTVSGMLEENGSKNGQHVSASRNAARGRMCGSRCESVRESVTGTERGNATSEHGKRESRRHTVPQGIRMLCG